MTHLADLYLEYAGWIFLAGFALLTVLLAAAGGGRLSPRWWIGSAVSGAVVIGLSLLVVLALQGLGSGGGGLGGTRWLAILLAGLIGFAAGTDIQLAASIVGRGAHLATVISGAIIGPVLMVGGYLFLLRTMDWVRIAWG